MEKAKSKIYDSLKGIYPEQELTSILRLLLSKISGMNFTSLILNKNTIFSDIQRNELDLYLQRLMNTEPIQYVLGETEFYGLSFKVDASVLIPRPETEELVDWILKDNTSDPKLIVDFGTGSGCIPIALKSHLTECKLVSVDISEEALGIAEENSKRNGVEIEFYRDDVLNLSKEFLQDFNSCVDVIVSNPPYIPASEVDTILNNVKDFEPHLALFVPDNDPLLFYRKIADYSFELLKANGLIYFEIHRDFGNDCLKMLVEKGFRNVVLKNDIFGNPRMIKALKPL